tara:strand:+ start:267 stop:755 length:489 start_codon:yes stop_codon:yes gene_type:complete
MDLDKHKQLSKQKRKKNQSFFRSLKKVKPKTLDNIIHNLHDDVFNYTDCLMCANCCKTTGPLFTNKDIQRISKYLKLKPSIFTEKYLRVDEDNDYVLQNLPCIFLNKDNFCGIYEVRPKACKEFPHTDRKKQSQLLSVTEKNISVCPAVYDIVEKMKDKLIK